MDDPLLELDKVEPEKPEAGKRANGARQRFVLEETGFNEVPRKYRKFYRKWQGEGDSLAINEVLCPVCLVVIRSSRELRPGDRVYCMPCMSRLIVAEEGGLLVARVVY
jgi:hypothetical protein